MENKILIIVHIISIIMFGITVTSTIEKRRSLRPVITLAVTVFGLVSIITSIRELIMLNYDLTWVFPQWYLARIMSCLAVILLINDIVKKQARK